MNQAATHLSQYLDRDSQTIEAFDAELWSAMSAETVRQEEHIDIMNNRSSSTNCANDETKTASAKEERRHACRPDGRWVDEGLFPLGARRNPSSSSCWGQS